MTSPLRRYARTGHRKVEGWLLPAAVDVLLKLIDVQSLRELAGSVCEIGVHHGRLFILLSLATRDDELAVAYDLFENQDENADGSGRGDRARLLLNLEKHQCPLARVKTVRVNSTSIGADTVLEDCALRPRLFSIDGGHTAEITQHDIGTASGSLCRGGIIILDDFFNETWPGVADGTARYMTAHPDDLIPFAIAGNKVLLTNDERWARDYRHALAALSQKYFVKDARLFNHDVVIVWIEKQPLRLRIRSALFHLRQKTPAPVRRGLRKLLRR